MVQRPTRQGIAFRGFKEKSLQAQVEEDEEEEEEEEGRKSGSDAQRPRYGASRPGKAHQGPGRRKKKVKGSTSSWKKGQASREPTDYQSLEDLVRERAQEATVPSNQRIIDMTKPGTRELSTLDIRSTPTGGSEGDPTLVPELRYNVRYLRDMALAEVEKCAGRVAGVRKEILQAGERERTLQCSLDRDRTSLARLEEVKLVMDRLKTKLHEAEVQGLEEPRLEELVQDMTQEISHLYSSYRPEYLTHRMDRMVASILATLLRRHYLPSWSPLEEPERFLPLVKCLRPYLPTSEEFSQGIDGQVEEQTDEKNREKRYPHDTGDEAEGHYTRHLLHASRSKPSSSSLTRPTLTMSPYESTLYSLWLPPVRSAISNSWDPKDPEGAIRLLEAWAPPLLPRFMHRDVCEQLIIPKLRRALDSWRPRVDPVRVHTWLHPWLHLLPRASLDDLFIAIRHKLSLQLTSGHWQPSDTSAISLLTPWKDVWREEEMTRMLDEAIVPRLAQLLEEDLIIDPANQEMYPIHCILPWSVLLPSSSLALLFSRSFFPKWLSTLEAWLISPDSDYEEIIQWYVVLAS